MKRPAFLLVCLPLTACFTLSPSVSTSRCENCFRFVFILLAVHDFFFERLRPSSPVCGSPVSLRMSSIESFQKSEDVIPRKAVSASLAAALITFLNPQNAFANGAGAWAKHDGPFTDSDFAGFSATASGLKFYDVEVGSGPVPIDSPSLDRRSKLTSAVTTSRERNSIQVLLGAAAAIQCGS